MGEADALGYDSQFAVPGHWPVGLILPHLARRSPAAITSQSVFPIAIIPVLRIVLGALVGYQAQTAIDRGASPC